MAFVQTFSLFAFALFSLVDLRSRMVPLLDIFFVLAGLLVLADQPWHVLALAAAVLWGGSPRLPARLALPLLFHPAAWPILLVGYGVRRRLIGRADLFAVGTIGLLFPLAAVLAALAGLELWRRWWVGRGHGGYIPALPGLFLGLAVFALVQLALQAFHVLPG